jgi:ABC-type nitrate/sulfonate/bicarbonate transport system substrate-binding protein
MAKFRVQTHQRLQEWVAEEKGYFGDEGLDYEFVSSAIESWSAAGVRSADEVPADFRSGAFESIHEGRACDVSAACHWAVNMASAGGRGHMWGHAYSVTTAGIYVAPESPIRKPEELSGVEVGVGYHSGSHFSALQALEAVLSPEQITLRYIGHPPDRLAGLLSRGVPAANLFGPPLYIAEQQGFRKVLDTSFMIGFLVSDGTDMDDVAKYFRALQRAQRDIDLEPEKFKHYFLREIPEKYHSMCDVRAFGTGERIVFEPYTREMFESTHRWMLQKDIFEADKIGQAPYESAVLA